MKRYSYALLFICMYLLPVGGCANQDGRLETEQFLARMDKTIEAMAIKPAPAAVKVEQAPVVLAPTATPRKVAVITEKPTTATAQTEQTPVVPAPTATPGKVVAMTEKPTATTAMAKQARVVPASTTPPGKVTNAIVAIVNDEVVTLNEIIRESQSFIREAEKKAPLDDIARSQIRRSALERVVEKKLVEQKIKELNIKVSDEEIRQAIDDVKKQNNMSSQEALVAALAAQGLSFDQYRAQLQEQLEKLKLVSMEVRAKIHVSETEMREFYDANRSKYTEDESFRARHIFFKMNEKSGAEEIKRSMTNALTVLAETKSGKDFVELAKTYSEDPAARKDGGDLGIFKKGDMQPELESAIIAMKPGEVSELVYTPVGLHIIKLEERISGKLKPFEGLKASIEEAIYSKKSEERFSQWTKELRAKASIEIKELKGLL